MSNRTTTNQPEQPTANGKTPTTSSILTDADLEAAGWPPLPELTPYKPAEEKSRDAGRGTRHAARSPQDVWQVHCCQVEVIAGHPIFTTRCEPWEQEQCPVRLFLETLAWSDETYDPPAPQPPALNFAVFPEPRKDTASSRRGG